MLSAESGKGKGGCGPKSIQRCHQVTRNQSSESQTGGGGHSCLKRVGHQLKQPSLVVQYKDKQQGNRTRPTNNQLLYKAYFRWQHYLGGSACLEKGVNLPPETDACASVTAAFLQIIQELQGVEQRRSKPRNVLKLLARDTRRTKVVDLASATHRVTDELKRHSLVDDEQHEYTTNLDRNRYGTDDQYLFTVIRYNLCLLDLCPCLVDVEVLDQKSKESILVSAGEHACTCFRCEKSLVVGSERIVQSVSRNDRLDALLEAATMNTVNEASSANGSGLKHGSVKQRAKCRSMSVQSGRKHPISAGEVDSLQYAVNALKADPIFTSTTRDSSKKLVPMRSFSSYQPVSRQLEGSINDLHAQWGHRETVDENVRGSGSATGEAHPPHETVVTGSKRDHDDDQDDPGECLQSKKSKIGNEASSIGPRTTANSEYRRLQAEVAQLAAEGRKNREEFLEARKEILALSSFKKDFDEDRSRWRKVEMELQGLRTEVRRLAADRAVHVEKSQAAEQQLVENRQVINILLNRLHQLLMATQAQSNRNGPENQPTNSTNTNIVSQSAQDHRSPGQASSATGVSQLSLMRHPSQSGVDHVPQMHLPANVVLALSKHHTPEQIHDQLSPSLLCSTRSIQDPDSVLGRNQDDGKIPNGSKSGIHEVANSLDLRKWDPSNESVNVTVTNIDRSPKLPLGIPAVELVYDGEAMHQRIG